MKILGSDIDGTLNYGGVDQTKCEAIRAWRRAGHLFGLVSGRGPSYLEHLKAQYPDLEMDFFAAFNGAFIVDFQGTPLHTTPCHGVPSHELTEFLLDAGCPFIFVNGETCYTVKPDGAPLTEGEIHLSQLPRDLAYFHQISVQLETPAEAAVVTAEVKAAYGTRLNPLQNHICIDIVAPTVNKAFGLRQVAALYDGAEADIIAVGDNLNDLDMLKAFRSYAMENGVEEAKRVATDTVKSVTELILRELEA